MQDYQLPNRSSQPNNFQFTSLLCSVDVFLLFHRADKFYECCGDTPYPSIYFTIYMRRKYLFYITNIIAPCVMLSILVTMVFYLPPEAGEKISLGITVLLAFTVFLLLIAESIPKRSDSVPIISKYSTHCINNNLFWKQRVFHKLETHVIDV